MLDPILRFLGFFDSHGLRHSIAHLNSIREDIAFWPINIQAKYADAVCVSRINTTDLLTLQYIGIDPDDTSGMEDWNATAVGNLAYTAMHCKDMHVATNCAKYLYTYKEFKRKQKLKIAH